VANKADFEIVSTLCTSALRYQQNNTCGIIKEIELKCHYILSSTDLVNLCSHAKVKNCLEFILKVSF
jgi:hypothetical protein